MRILRWSLKSHTHIVVDANKHSMHIDIGVGYNHNEQKAKEKLKKPSWGLLTRAWGAPNCRPHRARTKFPSSAFSLSLFCAPHHGMGWRRSMHICSFCLWGHMVSCHSTFVSCLFSHHTNTHSIFPWFRIECDKDECIEFIWDYNFFLFCFYYCCCHSVYATANIEYAVTSAQACLCMVCLVTDCCFIICELLNTQTVYVFLCAFTFTFLFDRFCVSLNSDFWVLIILSNVS